MNLEHIEQRCLGYLKQSKNPLVPFDTLLAHCRQDDDCAGISEKILMDFLRKHDEVRVLDGPGQDAPIAEDTFAAAGLIMGTRIIHRDRVPTTSELATLVKEHIAGMITALDAAIADKSLAKDPKRKADLEDALQRALDLKQKAQERF